MKNFRINKVHDFFWIERKRLGIWWTIRREEMPNREKYPEALSMSVTRRYDTLGEAEKFIKINDKGDIKITRREILKGNWAEIC
jgi:hypothetical protein